MWNCLAVHQDVQHRLARHQLQIRGLLRRLPDASKVRLQEHTQNETAYSLNYSIWISNIKKKRSRTANRGITIDIFDRNHHLLTPT